MSSLASIVSGSRLQMQSLQLRLNSAGRLLPDSDSVSWDASCLEDLRWWSDESHLLVGLPLGLSHPSLSLFSRRLGFRLGCLPRRRPHIRFVVSPLFQLFDKPPGAPCSPLQDSGVPSSSQVSVHQPVCGQHHCFGLLEEPGWHSFIRSLIRWRRRSCVFAKVHRVRLVLQFIPGRLNVLADTLSRRSQALGSEWTLCFPAFKDLLLLWPGDYRPLRHIVEPSPSRLLLADGRSAVGGHGCDDAALGWSSGLCLPSLCSLLQRIIAKVRQSRGLELTLVAPFWPQHPWFPDLLELLVAVPVFLPRRKDLLRQPHFHCFHQNLLRASADWLTAYRISSAPPAYLRLLFGSGSTACLAADAPPPE